MGSEISPQDRENFNNIVLRGRKRYQELSRCAANYYNKIRQEEGLATPAPESASTSRNPTPALTAFKVPSKSRSKAAEESQSLKEKQQQHMKNVNRPNVHVGLHYAQIMEEYGLPSLCNVLIGEDKHR